MSSENVENINKTTNSNNSDSDAYFLHFLKYEQCIYVLAVVGAVSQIVVVCVIIGHLVTGLGIDNQALEDKGVIYSAVAIAALIGSAFSEILLMRAVNQRFLRYIQWWVMSTVIIFIFSILMTVIAGFTLYKQALWITLGFFYLSIRLPFQIYFVDRFAQAEIIHKEPHAHNQYKTVLYNRFH